MTSTSQHTSLGVCILLYNPTHYLKFTDLNSSKVFLFFYKQIKNDLIKAQHATPSYKHTVKVSSAKSQRFSHTSLYLVYLRGCAGIWRVSLEPVEAGGPYNVTVASHHDRAALTDVLFGDVWLCGGQSNMFFKTSQVRVPAWAHPHRTRTAGDCKGQS